MKRFWNGTKLAKIGQNFPKKAKVWNLFPKWVKAIFAILSKKHFSALWICFSRLKYFCDTFIAIRVFFDFPSSSENWGPFRTFKTFTQFSFIIHAKITIQLEDNLKLFQHDLFSKRIWGTIKKMIFKQNYCMCRTRV